MADHRLFAAAYDHLFALSEARGLADRRERLLASAEGRVLELGPGTGLNLRHYRRDLVSEIIGVEPDGAMRTRLAARSATMTIPFEVRAAGIDDVSFPDASFDTVVATLVFCSVADPDSAARAVHRWLVPGGRLLFLEHVRAVGPGGWVQHAVTPLWARAAGGCHLDRDTLNSFRRSGLVVSDCERFALPAGGPLLRSCVHGTAWRRPVGLPEQSHGPESVPAAGPAGPAEPAEPKGAR